MLSLRRIKEDGNVSNIATKEKINKKERINNELPVITPILSGQTKQ